MENVSAKIKELKWKGETKTGKAYSPVG